MVASQNVDCFRRLKKDMQDNLTIKKRINDKPITYLCFRSCQSLVYLLAVLLSFFKCSRYLARGNLKT